MCGSSGYIGGVTGQHWRAGRVENCYNVGTVSGPATVGGITGGHKAASPELENCYNAGNVVDTAGYANNIGAVIGAGKKTVANCYYLTGTGTDRNEGAVETDSVSAAALGEAFTDSDSLTILKWELSVSGAAPARPAFSESTKLSALLAAYIKDAVGSAKAHRRHQRQSAWQ